MFRFLVGVRVDENGDIYFVTELTPQSAQSLLCKPQTELESAENY